MNKENLVKSISERLIENMDKVRFGAISFTLKIHESNVVSISHEITEKTIQKQETRE